MRLFTRPRLGTAPLASAAVAVGALAVATFGAPAALADAGSGGGVSANYFPLPPEGVAPPQVGPAPGRTITATISPDGLFAVAPPGAPLAVARAIRAANRIAGRPYRWGGGHMRFRDSGYDCSGAVSFALHGAGLVMSPLDSTGFMRWGRKGAGSWITVYANRGHAYVVIAGLRFDTAGSGGSGPRWRLTARPDTGFRVRHFPGL